MAPCVTAFEGIEVFFVAVRCPLEILERREKTRGDRREGMARYQHQQVHSHGIYDIEVDTSAISSSECAARILERMRSGPPPSAFGSLTTKLAKPD